jgi:hypothetical protein
MFEKGVVQVELNGGLGNQLFQWATGASLAINHQVPLELHTYRLRDCRLELSNDLLEKIWQKTSIKNSVSQSIFSSLKIERITSLEIKSRSILKFFFEEEGYNYAPIPMSNRKIFLRGYFQSWKYFEDQIPSFRSALSQFRSSNQEFMQLQSTLEREPWVAVHLRRGDYLFHKATFSIIGKEYYEKALQKIYSTCGVLRVVVFTDSPEFVTEVIPNHDLVISNTAQLSSMENMILMSNANALIGANSTFSWWAGLTMDEDNIKIFPQNWFNNKVSVNDLLLPAWKCLSDE